MIEAVLDVSGGEVHWSIGIGIEVPEGGPARELCGSRRREELIAISGVEDTAPYST